LPHNHPTSNIPGRHTGETLLTRFASRRLPLFLWMRETHPSVKNVTAALPVTCPRGHSQGSGGGWGNSSGRRALSPKTAILVRSSRRAPPRPPSGQVGCGPPGVSTPRDCRPGRKRVTVFVVGPAGLPAFFGNRTLFRNLTGGRPEQPQREAKTRSGRGKK